MEAWNSCYTNKMKKISQFFTFWHSLKNEGMLFTATFKIFLVIYVPLALILTILFYGIFQMDEAIQRALLEIHQLSQTAILMHLSIYYVVSLVLLFGVVVYLSVLIVGHRRMVEALGQSSKEIIDLYNHAPCGYHSLDVNGYFIRINETELRWTGYSADEVIGKMKLSDFLTPASYQRFQEEFPRFKEQGFINDLEYEVRRKDGSLFHVLLNATAVYDNEGRYVMSRSTLFDITVRQGYEAKIRELAFHDPLTRLPNRQLLLDRINEGLTKSEHSQLLLAILFLDLDKFKEINDQLGHDIGDELLQTIAVRISASVRGSDTVARAGGDEFIVVLPEINDRHDAVLVAQKILEGIKSPLLIQGYELDVSASIGVAFYPSDGSDAFELMKKADIAMYVAKDAGGNCYRLYSV